MEKLLLPLARKPGKSPSDFHSTSWRVWSLSCSVSTVHWRDVWSRLYLSSFPEAKKRNAFPVFTVFETLFSPHRGRRYCSSLTERTNYDAGFICFGRCFCYKAIDFKTACVLCQGFKPENSIKASCLFWLTRFRNAVSFERGFQTRILTNIAFTAGFSSADEIDYTASQHFQPRSNWLYGESAFQRGREYWKKATKTEYKAVSCTTAMRAVKTASHNKIWTV